MALKWWACRAKCHTNNNSSKGRDGHELETPETTACGLGPGRWSPQQVRTTESGIWMHTFEQAITSSRGGLIQCDDASVGYCFPPGEAARHHATLGPCPNGALFNWWWRASALCVECGLFSRTERSKLVNELSLWARIGQLSFPLSARVENTYDKAKTMGPH